MRHAQVMLSITRAPTCVLASREISSDTQDEGKSINTAVSSALIYTNSVEAGTIEAVYT